MNWGLEHSLGHSTRSQQHTNPTIQLAHHPVVLTSGQWKRLRSCNPAACDGRQQNQPQHERKSRSKAEDDVLRRAVPIQEQCVQHGARESASRVANYRRATNKCHCEYRCADEGVRRKANRSANRSKTSSHWSPTCHITLLRDTHGQTLP